MLPALEPSWCCHGRKRPRAKDRHESVLTSILIPLACKSIVKLAPGSTPCNVMSFAKVFSDKQHSVRRCRRCPAACALREAARCKQTSAAKCAHAICQIAVEMNSVAGRSKRVQRPVRRSLIRHLPLHPSCLTPYSAPRGLRPDSILWVS